MHTIIQLKSKIEIAQFREFNLMPLPFSEEQWTEAEQLTVRGSGINDPGEDHCIVTIANGQHQVIASHRINGY